MKDIVTFINEAIFTSKNNVMKSQGTDQDTVLDLIKSVKNNGYFEWEMKPGKIVKIGVSKESLGKVFSGNLLDPEVFEYLVKTLEKNEGKDWKFETDKDIKGRDLIGYDEFLEEF